MTPRVACYGRLSIQVYRHGDRAPTKKLPIDIYNESYWDYGYGELTNVSSVRLFYKFFGDTCINIVIVWPLPYCYAFVDVAALLASLVSSRIL